MHPGRVAGQEKREHPDCLAHLAGRQRIKKRAALPKAVESGRDCGKGQARKRTKRPKNAVATSATMLRQPGRKQTCDIEKATGSKRQVSGKRGKTCGIWKKKWESEKDPSR